jgi:hypothetical protein
MDLLSQLSQLSAKDIFGLGVIAAIVTTTGSLLAMLIKEYFLARSLEQWKERRSLGAIYSKYRDPIVLSASELALILNQICEQYPTLYLQSRVLALKPKQITVNSPTDEYYLKYKLTCAVYRLCAFLGWLELYRQEVVFLNSGKNRLNRRFETCIRDFREDLAEGRLNKADDWQQWKDPLIFREEQRAIGARMIVDAGKSRVVMDYGEFSKFFQAASVEEGSHWIAIATNFFLDPNLDKDFREARFHLLILHLVDLVEILDPNRVTDEMKLWREKIISKTPYSRIQEQSKMWA